MRLGEGSFAKEWAKSLEVMHLINVDKHTMDLSVRFEMLENASRVRNPLRTARPILNPLTQWPSSLDQFPWMPLQNADAKAMSRTTAQPDTFIQIGFIVRPINIERILKKKLP